MLFEALDEGDVPDASDLSIRPYLQQLQHHLKLLSATDEDNFLLRYALVVPGRRHGIRPPISVISPERGGFSQRRVDEAAAQFSRLRFALSLGRRYLGPLSSDPRIAVRELGNRIESEMTDADWIRYHDNLPKGEVELLAEIAITHLDASSEDEQRLGIEVLECLANFRREGLGNIAFELLRREIFWPGSLFRDAPDPIAAGLIGRIARADRLQLNHLLSALAWTRGEPARLAFNEWRGHPQGCSANLRVQPEHYLSHAGWTLTRDGRHRELISHPCHRLVKFADNVLPDLAVPCRTETESRCPGCGTQLRWLFDFSKLPALFFPNERLCAPRRLLYCPNCTCFGPVFSRYDLEGGAEWLSATASPVVDGSDSGPSCGCGIMVASQPSFAAAATFEMEDATSLGGIPTWLQDAEYPECPDCRQTLSFLAQFDNLSMPQPEEGIFYAFFCEACHVAAVTYQQT